MAFAPGKVILLGEHAVVYGHPALAGALGSGVAVVASTGSGALRVPKWEVEVRAGDAGSPLAQAYTALVERLAALPGWRMPPVDLEARFELPTGAGLGSSAALSVAIVRALAQAAGCELDHATLCDAAMAAETVFHGRPSGIDHAVAARGGFGLYTRDGGLRPIDAAVPVPLCVGHTGRARDTRGRVGRVAELNVERPEETKAHFTAIEALVRRAAAAVEAGELDELGAAMDENQRHLEALDVSCPEIEEMCTLARGAGAVGAKLTGGGGGGCVIALAPGRELAVGEAWANAGYRSFFTEVGRLAEPIGRTRSGHA
jgi:mevalonate kinase